MHEGEKEILPKERSGTEGEARWTNDSVRREQIQLKS
jgi:hypothetical protein